MQPVPFGAASFFFHRCFPFLFRFVVNGRFSFASGGASRFYGPRYFTQRTLASRVFSKKSDFFFLHLAIEFASNDEKKDQNVDVGAIIQ